LSETNVTDSGWKLAAAGTAAGTAAAAAAAAAADGVDPEATAPPVSSPTATIPAATSPALTTLDIDRHDPFALITTRIRCKCEPIADPGWAGLPIWPRKCPATLDVLSRSMRKTAKSGLGGVVGAQK
jgi:hypothetical protein